MTKHILRALTGVVVAALFVASTPNTVWAADREHQQMMADLRMLQEQSQQLQALLNGLGEALKAVNTRLDEQTGLERKAFADGKVQMDGMSNDIRIVREKVDETNVRLGSLQQELESLRDAMPQPGMSPAAPPTTSDAAPLPDGTLPAASPAVSTAPTPAPPGISPERLYTSSFADYSAGSYSLAISGFESYLKYFPKGAQAPQVQLYIAQSYEADKKPNEALAAYDRVIANYPNASEQAASAYFKRGVILESMGQPDRARASYEAALKQYPTAAAAILSKNRLEGLNKTTR